MTGPVRAVLFDLDGVLIDSYEAWFAVVNATAKELGAPAVSRGLFRSIFGQGIAADLVNLYPGRTRETVEACYVRAMAGQSASIHVNPEALAVLAELRARGIARACVTNTQIGLAHAILGASRLASGFDDVEGARPGVREKPAPDLLLAAMRALGCRPDEALMVGDSRYDEEAATAARVPFVSYDLKSGGSLSAVVRDALASRPPPGAVRPG